MAVSGNVFYMDDTNTEDFVSLCTQLQGLLHTANNDFEDMVASGLINRMALHKPFRSSDPNFGYDFNNPSVAEAARVEARRQANQGFDVESAKIGTTSDLSGIVAKYNNTDEYNGWEYLHPRGDSVSPTEYIRMRDFDGYNHAAEPFIGGFTVANRWTKEDGAIPVAFMVVEQNGSDLSHKDIPAITDSYIGVAFVASDGAVSRVTSDNPISSGGISVNLPVDTLNAGTYDIYPFLSQKKLNLFDGGTIACNTYTLPNLSKKTLVLADKKIVMVIAAAVTASTTLTVTVKVTNNSAGAVTIQSNEIRIRNAGYSWDATKESDEVFAEGTPADFTVAAGQTSTLTCPITGVSFTLQQNCTIWVSLQSGLYKQSSNFNSLNPNA